MNKYLCFLSAFFSLFFLNISCDSNDSNSSDTDTTTVVGKWSEFACDFIGNVRADASSFVIGEKLYVFGGYNGKTRFNDLYVIDFSSTSPGWTQLSSLDAKADITDKASADSARNLAAAFAIGEKGYICGGYNGRNYLKDFWEYNPSTDRWTQLQNFPGTPRYATYAFSAGTKGIVGGGCDGVNYPLDAYAFNPALKEWSQVNSLSEGRASAAVFAIDSHVFLVGGVNSEGYPSGFWKYDINEESWLLKTFQASNSSSDTGDIKRQSAAAFVIDGKGYLTCGIRDKLLKSTWEYDPVKDVWTEMADFTGYIRQGAIGASVHGRGMVLLGKGGFIYLDNVLEFLPKK
ncbi:MAG: kelch repeat-containing protein [Dysgonamonadaceae bacterium]